MFNSSWFVTRHVDNLFNQSLDYIQVVGDQGAKKKKKFESSAYNTISAF